MKYKIETWFDLWICVSLKSYFQSIICLAITNNSKVGKLKEDIRLLIANKLFDKIPKDFLQFTKRYINLTVQTQLIYIT